MKIFKGLKENLEFLKKRLNSDDIEFVDLKVGENSAVIIFVKDITDKDKIGDFIFRPIAKLTQTPNKEQLLNTFLSPEKKTVNNLEDIIEQVVSGCTALICDGMDVGFIFNLIKFERRSIVEPPTSTVIKGPREGFVESLDVNISLIRRKLKTSSLKVEDIKIGRYSKTPVSICYIDGIVDKKIIDKVKNKLNDISIDAVLDSSYVAKFLGEHKTSLFRQVGSTEKPDILAAKMLEGRVAIFVDGSPIALTVPYLLIEDLQSPSDYYSSAYSATFARSIRIISVIIAILLPAFYVSAELFHLQLIPLSFLLTIVNSIKGIPLSASYEMFFTLMIFEILNEASVRMPKYVGMVVSIVGGLVLGETAVTAGIISAPTLMIIAFSGICLYTAPELEHTFSIIRFIFLIVAGSVGVYGILCSLCFMIIYLTSFENYSTPLMAPFSPLITKDLKDSIYKGFLLEQSHRPVSLKNVNVKGNLKRKG